MSSARLSLPSTAVPGLATALLPGSCKSAEITIDEGGFGPVSSTIGRASALLPWYLLGDPAQAIRRPRKEQVKKVVKRLAEEGHEPEDVLVRLNRTGLLTDLGRVWRNERLGPISKLFGSLMTTKGTLTSALTRGDHYNPFSRTAQIFAEPTTGHELGHAVDLDPMNPTLAALARMSPAERMRQELAATTVALDAARDDDRADLKRVLTGAAGSYAAGLGNLNVLAPGSTQAAMFGGALAGAAGARPPRVQPARSARNIPMLASLLGTVAGAGLGHEIAKRPVWNMLQQRNPRLTENHRMLLSVLGGGLGALAGSTAGLAVGGGIDRLRARRRARRDE